MITGKKEYRDWLFLLCAVFLAVLAAVARGGLTAEAAEVSLVRLIAWSRIRLRRGTELMLPAR